MPIWVLIVWLIIGVVSGLLAQKFMRGPSAGGLLADLVMGIVGALLAGYGLSTVLPDALRGALGGLTVTLLAAMLGAMTLIWVVRRLQKTA